MTLAASDVLARDPAAQAISLPDGRLLVRHAGGASLLGGVSRQDLERVLAQVDGIRTAMEIVAACAALDPPISEREARGLLVALDGEMLRRVAMGGEGADAEALSIVLLGNSAFALRIERELRRMEPGVEVRRLEPHAFSADEIAGAVLVLCALEDSPYRDLLAAQTACLSAGVPALFVTADPDGVRIGPTAVPGVGPCFGCAQLAALRFARLDPQGAIDAAAELRAGIVDAASQDATISALLAEVRELLRPGGEPGLIGSLLLLPPQVSGSRPEARRLPLERDPACPLCAATPAPRTALAERTEISIAESDDRRPPRAAASFREEPEAFVRSVGIVGGGTAGYLAALALRRRVPGLAITLIESPDLPIIGVGEATTPLLPQFLHVDLGLDVHTLLAEVRPTFKLGIRFLWGAPGNGDFNYPFGPLHLLEPAVYGEPGGTDLRACSLQSLLMGADAVGLYRNDGGAEEAEGASWTSRLGTAAAYHLDNERFVAYLKRRAAAAGIERVEATLIDAETTDDGEGGQEVSALIAKDGRRYSFDLYVDCSGFRSFLLERAVGSPWRGFDSSLWTDRAVVAPVPHGGRVRPYTTAETYAAGWCWSTPQADADHRGYVFASAYLSPEDAEAEMRRGNPLMGEARLVRFRAGRHEHFWRGNVVALGNAYGFVEPLESTALHLLVRQIGLLAGAFPLRRADRSLAPLLNRRVAAWWDYLRWFLALHYRFNRRLDSPFWRAAREDVDVSLHAELLEAFRQRGPLSYDPAIRNAFDYPDPLWGPEGIDTLLLGQGVPCRLPRPHLPAEAWQARVARMRQVVARAAPHALALERFAAQPDLRESFVAAFRAAGPAFPAG